MSLAAGLRERALELGFVAVGIGTSEPLTAARRALGERFGAGALDGLTCFTPDRIALATTPASLLPGALSAISLAFPVAAHGDTLAPGPLSGHVASYARGLDYHHIVNKKLEALVAYLRERVPGVACRAFVDATPLLERALAARAGVGWIGKNNCLLVPGYGSWVLLAEVLTTASIEADTIALEGRCGDCRRCLDACPTNALAAPHFQLAGQCLSFATTELKGPIPRDMRPLLGGRVLGCDECQLVCPRNRPETVADEPEVNGGLAEWLDLTSLLVLGEKEYRSRFSGTAAERPRRRGLLRNAAVALGNSGDTAAVPALAAALEHAEPLVRGHAAWGLGRLGGRKARAALAHAAALEPDEYVRDEIEAARAAML
jgi:epoxyqueuosine reductase